MHQQPEQKGGGFFSLITNFFSSSRPIIEETKNAATDEAATLRGMTEEFKGRKSSKSLQVAQPSTMAFGKPLSLKDIAQIKNLASGH